MLDPDCLLGEHLAIEAIAADLVHHAGQRPLDTVAVAQTRWALSRHLLAHLAKEDSLLYPRLQRSPDTQVAALAHRFAAELGGLSDAFKQYMRHWSAERIAADADGFERDTHIVLSALQDRIHREESELYRHIPGAAAAAKVDAGARAA